MNSKEMTQQVADSYVTDMTKAYNYELKHGYSEDTDDDWNPYEDEETLTYYIKDSVEDGIGVEYVVDENLDYRSCIIILGFGGPNVYYHSKTGCVEVRWESRAIAYVDSAIQSMVDDMMYEYYNNHVKH